MIVEKMRFYIFEEIGWYYRMIYKQFNEVTHSPIDQVLINRGIKEKDLQSWLNAGWPQINSPWLFGKEKIKHAIKLINEAVLDQREIWVLVDCDADGFTSAALIINYLCQMYYDNEDTPYKLYNIKEHIHYILHTGKQHGLEDTFDQFPDNSLVILPDSSTNDVEEMRQLLNKNCFVICLDHHEADQYLEDEDNLVIINNQICDYPNKDISAAGVVWQLCRAMDQIFETNYASDYIDLAALGCLSDMMDYRSIETKAIILLGLQNIKNPFFYYMVEKNEYSINKMGGINYMSIAFYVTPFINAIVRSGTTEEKDLVFKSFLNMYAFEKIESGKRGHKGELVPRVEEAVRIATNVKARQTKLQDQSMALLESRIRDNNLQNDAIIVLTCEPGEVEKNIAGLVANKIQAKYQHPTLVLTKNKTENDNEYYYRGSARNYSMSENQDLRSVCLETDLVEYAQGHANAFGISIAESNIDSFIEQTNNLYADVAKEPVYWVDFIWTKNEIDTQTIMDIANAKEYWGQEIPEPYIALDRINLLTCNIQLLSADKHPTIKIHLDNGVDIMKFKSSQEEYEEFSKPNKVLTAVCKCAKNIWNNNISAQLIIENFELKEEWVF